MKRIIIIFSIILIIISSIFIVKNLSSNNINNNCNTIIVDKHIKNNFYTILLETDTGSGKYVESTNDEWPTEDYILNKKLSGCKNGSELTFDEKNKIVYVSAISSDSCYVYFDKGILFSDYIKNTVYQGDGNNDLYLHDGMGPYNSLEAKDNSYRYYGASPNNYVCFGTDEKICPVDNLYRIIGLFDDNSDNLYNIKLIKADYVNQNMLGTNGNYYGAYNENKDNYKGNLNLNNIAAYKWNDDLSINNKGSNNWATSKLNTINLNTNYWNNLGNKWQDMIELTLWHLKGHNTSAQTPQFFYNIERTGIAYGDNPTTYTDEIGLIYPSDYGFAASPRFWSTNIGSYDSAKDENWLYLGLYEWTITPVSGSSYRLYYLNINGAENGANSVSNYTLRPTFYLKPNIAYLSGSGTESDPYRIQ